MSEGLSEESASPTVQAALARGRALLAPSGADAASHDARFLLAGVLGTSPGQLALRRERYLSAGEWALFLERLARRARGEPLQYIEGRAAFRGLSLRVDRSVLIPRPETEQLVDCVLEWCRGKEGLVGLYLGTGSGAIALSLAVEGPFAKLVAVDISPEALNLARVNTAEAGVTGKVDLRRGSLFEPLRPDERFHVVVSNPPYIADDEAGSLPKEVRDWEPAVALYAGPTGLEFIAPIIDAAPRHLEDDGLLALEVTPGVADAAVERLRERSAYGKPWIIEDLAGQRRVLMAERVGVRPEYDRRTGK